MRARRPPGAFHLSTPPPANLTPPPPRLSYPRPAPYRPARPAVDALPRNGQARIAPRTAHRCSLRTAAGLIRAEAAALRAAVRQLEREERGERGRAPRLELGACGSRRLPRRGPSGRPGTARRQA